MKKVSIVTLGLNAAKKGRGRAATARKTSDRIWGVANIGREVVSFWGKADGRLRYMHWDTKLRHETESYADSQIAKGYAMLPDTKINQMFPDLPQRLVDGYNEAKAAGLVKEHVAGYGQRASG